MSTHKQVKNTLIQKVDALLKRAGAPERLHHYGPKKYSLKEHVMALLLKQECQLSYRRVENLLAGLGLRVPTYSALCKMMKRMPLWLWRMLFRATVLFRETAVAAVDSTGMQRSSPSWHYVHAIDRSFAVRRPLKLSIMVDTKRKKVLAARLRAKPAHDVRDFSHLLRNALCVPKVLVADKGYDSEALHEQCFHMGVKSMIPTRRSTRCGFYRKKAMKCFRTRTYNRRQIVECVFSALKRKYGASFSSRSWRTQNKEMHARLVIHNLFLFINRLFQQSLEYRKLFK
jgi:transposase